MSRVQVVGGFIEFDGTAVAQLKPHAKPGDLWDFLDYLNEAIEAKNHADDVVATFDTLASAIKDAKNELESMGYDVD